MVLLVRGLCCVLVFACLLAGSRADVTGVVLQRGSGISSSSSSSSSSISRSVESLVQELRHALEEIRHGAMVGEAATSVGDSAAQLRQLANAIDQSVAIGAATATPGAFPLSTTQVEVGSLEPLTCPSEKGPIQGPRVPVFGGKRGLFAIGVGRKGAPQIDALVRAVGTESFSFIFFVYDDSTALYEQFEWAKNVTLVHVARQIKYWYYKRFLHPDVVAGYDYLFLWDDDISIDRFEARGFVDLLDRFHIDLAQPAVVGSTYALLVPRTTPFGRWSSFIEIQVPVLSRAAWRDCVYPMLQWDLSDAVGLDVIWTQVCAARGFDRVAVIDPHTVIHRNMKTMARDDVCSNRETLHNEVMRYLSLGAVWCPSCFAVKPEIIYFAHAPILSEHTTRAMLLPILQPLRVSELPGAGAGAGAAAAGAVQRAGANANDLTDPVFVWDYMSAYGGYVGPSDDGEDSSSSSPSSSSASPPPSSSTASLPSSSTGVAQPSSSSASVVPAISSSASDTPTWTSDDTTSDPDGIIIIRRGSSTAGAAHQTDPSPRPLPLPVDDTDSHNPTVSTQHSHAARSSSASSVIVALVGLLVGIAAL